MPLRIGMFKSTMTKENWLLEMERLATSTIACFPLVT